MAKSNSRPQVNIGDTDKNADWLRTPEGKESEKRIHDKLEKDIDAKAERRNGNTG